MTLFSELTNGPLSTEIAPHITSGNDAEIADIINRKDIAIVGSISANTFAMWAAKTGLRAAIQDHASATASPLRSIALTLLDFLQGNLDRSLSLDNPENSAMLDAWVTAGALSTAQRDELLRLAETKISRAEQLGLGLISANDVRNHINQGA